MGAKLAVLSLPKENSCGCADRAATDAHQCLCPTTGLVQIMSRKYALSLLSLIAERGNARFGEIKSALGDLSTSTLSIRLAELEQAKLIDRRSYSEMPPRVEYALTTQGERLRKSLIALTRIASPE
jgi:DNA-binding HxlR family transcriptional regulator